jgi:hypothetical protein
MSKTIFWQDIKKSDIFTSPLYPKNTNEKKHPQNIDFLKSKRKGCSRVIYILKYEIRKISW